MKKYEVLASYVKIRIHQIEKTDPDPYKTSSFYHPSKEAVSRDFLQFFYESNPFGSLIHSLKWFRCKKYSGKM